MDQGRIVMDGAKEAFCVNRANPRRDGWCCRKRIGVCRMNGQLQYNRGLTEPRFRVRRWRYALPL